MTNRIEKTMWVHWIGSNYKKEQGHGYPIPTFQRLDELFVSVGILKPESAPRIYRGERISEAGSRYGNWRRRRESEVWTWTANWLQSPESKIAFSPKGKETAVYMRELQDQIAQSSMQSLLMQMNASRTVV